MNSAATQLLGDKIDDAVDYCRREFDMSYAEAVGVLQFCRVQADG